MSRSESNGLVGHSTCSGPHERPKFLNTYNDPSSEGGGLVYRVFCASVVGFRFFSLVRLRGGVVSFFFFP